MLKKNQFSEGLINSVVNKYLDKVHASTPFPVDSKPPDGLCVLYFKIPYLIVSNFAQRKIRTIWLNGIVKISISNWYFLHLKLKT